MIFRQLFEPVSSTYTYLIGCPETGRAILIDPVLEARARDLAALDALDLTLAWTVETHVHADHVSAGAALRAEAGCRVACPAGEGVEGADLALVEGDPVSCGTLHLMPLATPGHTKGHMCYRLDRGPLPMVFTGDTLLIDGCGRTDFQGGDAAMLYRSIHAKLFSLADDTLVYPGHDYNGRHVTTIAQERQRNPRLGANKPLDEFVTLMNGLGLPYPKRMDEAVPANQRVAIPHAAGVEPSARALSWSV
ncbi:MAG TPA: MBL fold metallo-hydrolase [Candidatus Sulfotelmatobacter sp.]|nr:MBL fold metallo-hydrolase [Candidatus Sulfotelmatobacter sp.]